MLEVRPAADILLRCSGWHALQRGLRVPIAADTAPQASRQVDAGSRRVRSEPLLAALQRGACQPCCQAPLRARETAGPDWQANHHRAVDPRLRAEPSNAM